MRGVIAVLVSFVLFSSAGCSAVDMLFGLLGSKHYTGGGITDDEKKADFEREQDKWRR